MIKRLSVLCILIAVLISLVPLSVFADYSGVFTVDSLPTNSIPRFGEETPQSYIYFRDYNNVAQYGNIYVDSTASTYNENGYFFLIHDTDDASNKYRLVIATEGRPTGDEALIFSFGKSYNSGGDLSIRSSSTYNALLNLTYVLYETYIYGLPYCQVYSASQDSVMLNDGLNALRSAIDNGTAGGVQTSRNVTITVNPNNIAYIGYGGGSANISISLSGNNVIYSPFVSNASYWTTSTLPSGTTVVSDTQGTKIILNGTGDRTLTFGYQSAAVDIPLSGVGYLVIYNPYNQTNSFNFPLTVTLTDYVSCVQYPLNTHIGFNGLESSFTEDRYYVADNTGSNSSPEYLEYNTDGQGNTTTSPAISVPSGGSNIIIDEESDGLEGFIEKILNLFTAPIRYIQNLIESGSSFMAWISQLWYWLPPEVGVIIGSALAVIVVIGAIKLLWK